MFYNQMDLGHYTNGQADGFVEYLWNIILVRAKWFKPWFNTLNSNQVCKMRCQIENLYQNKLFLKRSFYVISRMVQGHKGVEEKSLTQKKMVWLCISYRALMIFYNWTFSQTFDKTSNIIMKRWNIRRIQVKMPKSHLLNYLFPDSAYLA